MTDVLSIPQGYWRPYLTETDLCSWIIGASVGETLEYYRGHLAVDTDKLASRLPAAQRLELVHVASRARWAFDHGLVHLVQRRLETNRFRYLLIVRPRSRKHAVALSTLRMLEAA